MDHNNANRSTTIECLSFRVQKIALRKSTPRSERITSECFYTTFQEEPLHSPDAISPICLENKQILLPLASQFLRLP